MRVGLITIIGGLGITSVTLLGVDSKHKREIERLSHLDVGDSEITELMRERLDSLRNDNKYATIHIVEKKQELEEVVSYQQEEIKGLEQENKNVSDEVKTLKKELKQLENAPVQTDTLVLRDTLYIKETKNFWGKSKLDTIR